MLRPTNVQTRPIVIMAISIAKSTAWVVREDEGGLPVTRMSTHGQGHEAAAQELDAAACRSFGSGGIERLRPRDANAESEERRD